MKTFIFGSIYKKDWKLYYIFIFIVFEYSMCFYQSIDLISWFRYIKLIILQYCLIAARGRSLHIGKNEINWTELILVQEAYVLEIVSRVK